LTSRRAGLSYCLIVSYPETVWPPRARSSPPPLATPPDERPGRSSMPPSVSSARAASTKPPWTTSLAGRDYQGDHLSLLSQQGGAVHRHAEGTDHRVIPSRRRRTPRLPFTEGRLSAIGRDVYRFLSSPAYLTMFRTVVSEVAQFPEVAARSIARGPGGTDALPRSFSRPSGPGSAARWTPSSPPGPSSGCS